MPIPTGWVRQGNERVLRARFNDARFFYNVDQHKKLADRVPDLAAVTFQAKLGSYLAKDGAQHRTRRNTRGQTRADRAAAERAATLAKADLTTEMVKEFTELQGIVGGIYAERQGESHDVAQAIYDQYKPASMEDSIPSTATGRIVSLADKLDTLKGCFAIGLVPTGSKDPFALRRAAQGLVKILVEGGLELNVGELLGDDPALREFIADRVKYYFREIRGFAYDEINAVMASGWDNLVDVEARLEALKDVRPTPNFEPLAASFKRINNILQAGRCYATGCRRCGASRRRPGTGSLRRHSGGSQRPPAPAGARTDRRAATRRRSFLRQSFSKRPARAGPGQPAQHARRIDNEVLYDRRFLGDRDAIKPTSSNHQMTVGANR